MKTIFPVLALAILTATLCHTQQRWVKHASTLPDHICASYFTDCNTGVAACKDSILRTTNGGGTWTRQTEWPSKSIYSISFVNAQLGFAVGGMGLIMRTTDGGLTWHDQDSPTYAILSGISFIDANTGTIVGMRGTVLRTTDGGDHWNVQHEEPWDSVRKSNRAPDWYVAVCMVDANSITAVGYFGMIMRSTNGGVDWVSQSDESDREVYHAVHFTDRNNGTCIGQMGTILHTTNGGAEWKKVESHVHCYLNSIAFTDANTGTIVGAEGTILHTMDGGATWNIETSGITTSLNHVFAFAQNKEVAVGWDGTILTRK